MNVRFAKRFPSCTEISEQVADMKKTALLNAEISHLIASLGHMDLIVIADSGLPVPKEVKRIDLALTEGVPGFIQTVEVVLSELQVEKAWIARELSAKPDGVHADIMRLMPDVELGVLAHDELKALCKQAVAVIRTGECSPYANVVLQSGVVF